MTINAPKKGQFGRDVTLISQKTREVNTKTSVVRHVSLKVNKNFLGSHNLENLTQIFYFKNCNNYVYLILCGR